MSTMREERPVALGGRATSTGLLLRPRTTWPDLMAAPQRRLWIPALLTVLLTVVLAFASAYADSDYRYRLALDWFEQQAAGQAPERGAVVVGPIALRALWESGALMLRWSVWSGALFLVARFLGKRHLSWDDALTLTLWGWLPLILRGLLQLAVTVLARRPVYNPGLSGLVYDATPPPLTALRYVKPSAQQWAAAGLLRGVDLFAGWQLLLTGWGLAAFAQMSTRKALGLTAVVWVSALLLHLVVG